MTDAPHIVFVPLAANQARFYISVARSLASRSLEASFLTFHEPSLGEIQKAGFAAASGFAGESPRPATDDALAVIERFGVPDVNLAISHERAAYEIGSGVVLVEKLRRYLETTHDVLQATARDGRQIEVVQELGGFLSVVGVFYATRRLGLRNTFIEPSFFRGRVFFTHDTFSAPRPGAPSRELTPEVRAVLDQVVTDKQIVIPAKDRAHYRPASKKLLSARNLRRLFEKTVDKHVKRRREEFDHLSGHVGRHVRMAVTSQRLRNFYHDIPSMPFVYYPLHVPADVALTIRAPEYFDQLALIEFLARVVPPTHLVAIKEHPALVGAFDYGRLSHLLRRYDNIRLLTPGINNHDVLAASDLVVTVNSKSGAEALLWGRRVIALGDSFYRDSGLVTAVDRLADLPAAMRCTLRSPSPDRRAVERFFQRVWDSARPGELYLDSPDNVDTFAASLSQALGLEAAAVGF
jgi:hypothetical protein